MNLARFTKFVYDPKRTSAEVQQMLKNALAKGEVEFAAVAKEALNKRFPDWDEVSYKKGGKTPTTVMFRGTRRQFDTAKEAYVWLMDRFVNAYPTLFTDLKMEEIAIVATRAQLFCPKPDKVVSQNAPFGRRFQQFLSDCRGYVNLNLANSQKRKILDRFAYVANLEYRKDWDWHVSGEPEPPEEISILEL